MNRLLIVGILIISTAPLYAQRQQQNVAKLKADARNVVGAIANDKAKTQTYCQILDLARQLAQATQEKDRKKRRKRWLRGWINYTERCCFRKCLISLARPTGIEP